MRIRRRFRFEAAHELPHHPGKCRHLHGHSYELIVVIEGPVQTESGMVVDFADLKRTVRQEVVDPLDHEYLNRVIDNPTAERVAIWIWDRLTTVLPGLIEVELRETEACSVVYRGE
jgi:6-pyruvoyltetrahydropterin/6-carboxytetrahydropterin synthase